VVSQDKDTQIWVERRNGFRECLPICFDLVGMFSNKFRYSQRTSPLPTLLLPDFDIGRIADKVTGFTETGPLLDN
jgi:hypothetical protein